MHNIIKTTVECLSFKYTRNKILYSLSTLLLLSVFTIIRYCQYPLLIHTQLLEKLFIPTSNDSTLYNIAISYVAAYIFYIIQVYIPAMLNHYKSYQLLSTSITKEIALIQKMIFICRCSLTISDNDIYINPTMSSFYFKVFSDTKTYLYKFTYTNSYEPYKEQLTTLHNQITSNPNLSFLDYAFLHKYYSIPINNFLVFMDNIARNIESGTNMCITSIHILEDFEKTTRDFVHSYGFITSTDFSLEVSETEKGKYQNTQFPEHMYALLLTPSTK